MSLKGYYIYCNNYILLILYYIVGNKNETAPVIDALTFKLCRGAGMRQLTHTRPAKFPLTFAFADIIIAHGASGSLCARCKRGVGSIYSSRSRFSVYVRVQHIRDEHLYIRGGLIREWKLCVVCRWARRARYNYARAPRRGGRKARSPSIFHPRHTLAPGKNLSKSICDFIFHDDTMGFSPARKEAHQFWLHLRPLTTICI